MMRDIIALLAIMAFFAVGALLLSTGTAGFWPGIGCWAAGILIIALFLRNRRQKSTPMVLAHITDLNKFKSDRRPASKVA